MSLTNWTSEHRDNEHQNVHWKTSSIVFAIMDVLFMIFIWMGNCFVLSVVHRNYSLHTYSNYFLAQLSLADLIVGLCMPLNIGAHEYRYKLIIILVRT